MLVRLFPPRILRPDLEPAFGASNKEAGLPPRELQELLLHRLIRDESERVGGLVAA